ncbi:biogenesis of lysosome-related organelles complex 1 subunit 5 isoform X1 [Rattus rattus]|uniref:biogenesis of lysosome-related organelles complex 1 subunit 5 isoform X1 n=1 Tax=Rattus rattus TaxID=10117 RepID=UPI0013F39A27|nr:biogenesis of lysosome-related organelles complex 1 subunit 5 isoform X1 [Rattus rattus]
MSGGGTETPVACEAAQGGGGKKRDSLGTAGAAHLIIKDLGEIHSRLLDHRPVTQGEIRYFVKEFEEKRGLRELRVLENLKNMIQETNERMLPKCRETMQGGLEETLQRLQAATDSIHRLQQREQERKKTGPRDPGLVDLGALLSSELLLRSSCLYTSPARSYSGLLHPHDLCVINDHLTASEKQRMLQWEEFLRGQPQRRAEVDAEHRKAMERLREQYAAMEKDLAKFSTF